MSRVTHRSLGWEEVLRRVNGFDSGQVPQPAPTPPIQYADTDSGHCPMIARTGRSDAPVLIAAAAADDDGGEPTNAILTRLMSRQSQHSSSSAQRSSSLSNTASSATPQVS